MSSLFCFSWPVKKLEKIKSQFLRGGKLLVTFELLWALYLQKEASGNFESETTFALVVEIYQPWKFRQFLLSRSWETSERGWRGPLKGKVSIYFFIVHDYRRETMKLNFEFLQIYLNFYLKGSQFAVPGAYKQLDCKGRHCANCGKCRDWYYIDPKTWRWVQHWYSWTNNDWYRYNHDKIWERFQKREDYSFYMSRWIR